MADLHLFRDLLSRFSEAKLLCVGDLMVDHFVYGDVKRVSPEAPVPVLRALRRSTALGGAGNVARNLASLTARCTLLGVVGEDGTAQEIQTLLEKLEGATYHLTPEKGRKTTVKTRYVSAGQQLLRVDEEDVYEISEATQKALLTQATNLLPTMDALILSDYGKGLLTDALIRGLIEAAQKAGKPVIVDPKRPDFSIYRGATLVTPNEKELQAATPFSIKKDEDVERATTEIIANHGIAAVLATRGDKGMTLNDGQKTVHISNQALEIYDVSGAGDTVIASVAAALAAGGDYETAAKLSNLSAGLVVAKAGTATVSLEEIHAALSQKKGGEVQNKAVDWATAKDQVIEWHRRGLKIGFANGCYDLLHPGHVSLLRNAKKSCDRLIVALNTDASVQRLKGVGRPVQQEQARAQVMAALGDVDLVVLFDQETPLELIQYLRPDVLVKGADYKVEDVVGAQEVLSWGGDVLLAPLEEGHSTTGLLKKAIP